MNECFHCYIFITNGEEGWARKNILSLVDPDSATISIVPELTIQEFSRLLFMAGQRARCQYCHGSGGSGGGPSCLYLPKEFNSLYRSTNISNSTPFRMWGHPCSQLNNALGVCIHLKCFIQFIFYMFYNDFFWSVRTYGIHCLFDTIVCSLYYSNLYYVYIVIVSYSMLNEQYNIE